MTRRTFVGSQIAAVAASQASGRNQPENAPAQRRSQSSARSDKPNILFIMADQLTPFMTSVYGQKVARTPNLDRLASRGTVFENAYCNSPLCVPSRTSMFTGRQVAPIEAWDNGAEFAAHRPTFVHYLRLAGYRTVVSGKTHFIGPDQMHGFDERLTPCIFPAGFVMITDWRLGARINNGTSMQSMLRMLGPSKWSRQLGYDEEVFRRAIGRLRRYATGKQDEPLFLNVSFTQPHDPFTTTAEFLNLYRASDMPLPKDSGDIKKLSPTYEWFEVFHGTNLEKLPPERIREARRNYLGMISWIDNRVGQLIDELDRLGMADNTVVIFTSDHGEMCGTHGQWSKRLMLEWSARIPLIVSIPGRPGGRRSPALVSLVDLFPTFTELAGAKLETPIDGRSLLPILNGTEHGRDREVVAEYLGEGTLEPIRMIRSGQYKIITTNGYPPQLFDLERDPDETTNLSGDRTYSAIEKKLINKAEQGWDGPALKRSVLGSQQERLLIRSINQHGTPVHWDYEPVEPGPYQS
ncbi:MAG: choline-sulfatase, partial [Acidobacteriaceae bacterium]|nr:choline-sulfatase [Acidobacteriaceae bacterium]